MTNVHQLLTEIPHAAALIHRSGRVDAINARCGQICGLDPAAFHPTDLGPVLRDVVAPDSRWRPDVSWDLIRRQLLHGVVVRLIKGPTEPVVVRLIDLTGEHSLLTLFSDPDTELSAFYDMERGVHGIMDALMRTVSSAVFVVDCAAVIVDHNELALQLCVPEGEESRMVVGTSLDMCLPLHQMGQPLELHPFIDRARERDRDLTLSTEIQIVPSKGRVTDVEITIAPIGRGSAHRGQPAALVFVHDAGEERQVWRELRKIQHAREISRAAVGIAHELNNSATALITHLSLLERELQHVGATSEELKNAHSAVRRIRRLGLQLERFSGMEGDEWGQAQPDQPTTTTADMLAETVQDTVALAVSGTSIRTTYAIDAGLPDVHIPADALSQALFNVVVNAVEAMDDGGTLHIEVHRQKDPDAAVIVVRDEGHGMDPRIVKKVFEPYFSTKHNGIGMGLTVSYSTLDLYGGRLDVETEPGFGTTVRLFLRTAATKPEVAGLEPDEQPAPVNFEDTRVLLVEDDSLVRRSLKRTLQTIGCRVTAVESGDRAIEVFHAEMADDRAFHLIITDLAMPGRNDGVQLLRRIRELDPDIPAVLSSGALHRQNASSYRDAGFQYVLRKPFGEAEVRYALSAALTAS